MENNTDIKFYRLLLVVITVNAAGLLLRFNELNDYINIIGFRFYLPFFIPVLFFLDKENRTYIKELFSSPAGKRKFTPLFVIIIPAAALFCALYFTGKADLGDPEYFYEFGLSSVFDYPIYLVWNFVHIALFLIVLNLIADKKNFIILFLFTLFLFVYSFVPLNKDEAVNYFSITSWVIASLFVSLLVYKLRNIYWQAVILFTAFWIHFLLYGSNSEEIINILYASRYSLWEGFFTPAEGIKGYLLPAHLFLSTIFVLLFKRKKVS